MLFEVRSGRFVVAALDVTDGRNGLAQIIERGDRTLRVSCPAVMLRLRRLLGFIYESEQDCD